MRANIRDNASKNAEQEKRYSAAIKGLFGIITGIAILVGYAFLAKHWR